MQTQKGRLAARVVAVIAAVFWGFLWFGVIDLLVVVEQDGRFHEDYLFESGRRRTGWGWRRPDPILSVLAVVGLPAAVAYGAPPARNTTDVPDITNGVSHYPMQASLALAVVGLVALAALTRSRLPTWTAAFSAVWLGVESVVYPSLKGSLGTTGGALTAGWGVVVVVAGEAGRRRALAAR